MTEFSKRKINVEERRKLYSNLEMAFPRTFAGIPKNLSLIDRRIRYTVNILKAHDEIDNHAVTETVAKKFGPLQKPKWEKSVQGSGQTIYKRPDAYIQMPQTDETQLINLMHTHPEWDSDKLQIELAKIRSSMS